MQCNWCVWLEIVCAGGLTQANTLFSVALPALAVVVVSVLPVLLGLRNGMEVASFDVGTEGKAQLL